VSVTSVILHNLTEIDQSRRWCTAGAMVADPTSPIKSETPLSPGKVILKMGIFPRIPEPEMESFAMHKHPWEADLEGTIKYKFARGGEKLEE
jgi:hypothetical protein